MNKLLFVFKNILILIFMFFNISFLFGYNFNNIVAQYGLGDFYLIYIVYLLVLILYFTISVMDIFTKSKTNNDNKYNLVCILALTIMSLVFIRGLYGTSFVIFDAFYRGGIYEENVANVSRTLFLLQNCIYFIIILISLCLYHHINKQILSKYNFISLICLLVSIISIIPTCSNLESSSKSIPYLIFTILLVGIEIWRLIKDNGKKREWIIYVSFLFNLFAFISFFIAA